MGGYRKRIRGVYRSNCLFLVDTDNQHGEIEYVIGPAFQGKGYATEMTRAVIGFGFEKINFNRIEIDCRTENEASRRVIEKCGLTYEGVFRDFFWRKDHFEGRRVFSILKSEWKNSLKESIFLSEQADVFYIGSKNVVLVHWKKYCELDRYREPLMKALDVIKEHEGCEYVADTRDGFEDNPLDTKWVADYFMPKARENGCSTIYFIIDKDNSLKEELEGQERDSESIIKFRYIYGLDEI